MTLKNDIISTPEGLCVWHQERSIFETTNLICEIMKETGISRKDLADKLGSSKGYITQLLDGTANMTLRTVSDVFVALGRQFHPAQSPLQDKYKYERLDKPAEMLQADWVTSATGAATTLVQLSGDGQIAQATIPIARVGA